MAGNTRLRVGGGQGGEAVADGACDGWAGERSRGVKSRCFAV